MKMKEEETRQEGKRGRHELQLQQQQRERPGEEQQARTEVNTGKKNAELEMKAWRPE